MLNIPEILKNTYRNDMFPFMDEPTPKDLVIYFPALNLTIETDQIVDDSFELNESLCSEEDLVFGSCEASKIKFTVADVEQDLKGQWFTIEQVIDGFDPVPLGVYKIDSCVKQDNLRFKDITAYDKLKDTDVNVADWYNDLFPTGDETYTLKQFRESLLTHLGIEYEDETLPNDDMIVEKTIEPTQISGRVVLEATVELNGAFGHINRQGKFTRIVLQPSYGLYPSETLYPSEDLYPVAETDTSYAQEDIVADTVSKAMYQSVRFEEYSVKEIDKLQIRAEENDIGAIVGGDQKRVIDTQIGSSIQSTKSDDSVVEITKIEGASSQVVTVQGKNLIDYTKAINIGQKLNVLDILNDGEIFASGNMNYCHFSFQLPLSLKGQTVSVSYSILESTSATRNIRLMGKKEDDSRYYITTNNGAKVTVPADATEVLLDFMLNNTPDTLESEVILRVKNIQLELGSTATPYEPFIPDSPSPEYPSPITSAKDFDVVAENEDATKSNKLTITKELNKLPNGVADTRERIDDRYVKYTQRIGKVVFDGSVDENWKIETNTTFGNRYFIYIPNSVTSDTNNSTAICSHFKLGSTGTTWTHGNVFTIASTSTLYISKNNETLTEFKTFLQANPVTVHYELAEPIETIVEEPSTLTSYKGITKITTNANPQVSLTADFYVNPINTYVIEGNFLAFGKSAPELDTIALNAFGNMAKRPYRPYEAQSIGLPYIEVGDCLEFATDDTVVGYVLQRTLTGIQGLKDEFEAPGSEEREQNFGVNKELIQLQGKTTRIKKDVEGVRVEVEDLAEDTASKFEQTAEQISTEVTRSTQAEGALDSKITQTAESITQEVTRATEAEGTLSGSIETLAGQVVLKVDSEGNIGYIDLIGDPDTELTSIKLKADNLSLEGLTTINNKFKVLANGTIEAADAKFSGTITGSIIRGSEIETYGNDGFIKSTSWDGETYGVSQNEILINNGVLRCSRTLYTTGGPTFNWATTISYDTVNTKKIVCDTINGKAPVDGSNFVPWDTFLVLYDDLNHRVTALEGS